MYLMLLPLGIYKSVYCVYCICLLFLHGTIVKYCKKERKPHGIKTTLSVTLFNTCYVVSISDFGSMSTILKATGKEV